VGLKEVEKWREVNGCEGGGGRGGRKGIEKGIYETKTLSKSHQRVDFIQQHFIPAFKPLVGL